MGCQIVDLSSFRKRKLSQKTHQTRKNRSQLNRMAALIDVYHAEMLQLSQDPQVKSLCLAKGIHSETQIATDVERLMEMRKALMISIEEKGAKDLHEAAQLIRYWAKPEILDTMDRLLASDFETFQIIAQMIDPVRQADQNYFQQPK